MPDYKLRAFQVKKKLESSIPPYSSCQLIFLYKLKGGYLRERKSKQKKLFWLGSNLSIFR